MSESTCNGRKVVCIKDACWIADVTRRTLYNWMETGKVEFVRTAGGTRRIFVDTLFRNEKEWPHAPR